MNNTIPIENLQQKKSEFTRIGDIQVSVQDLNKNADGKVYYQLQVIFKQNTTKQLSKLYSDFENLHQQLNQYHPLLPFLPAKSILKLSDQQLNQRRVELDKYLNLLVQRQDILMTEQLQIFLNLQNEVKISFFAPVQISTIKSLPLDVVNFEYNKQHGILFVALSDSTILNTVNNFLSMVIKPKNQDPKGILICYKEMPPGSYNFQKIWHKNYQNQISSMKWDQKSTILSVGFENGTIECLLIETEKNFGQTEFCQIKRHTKRVSGLAIHGFNGFLYSISTDKSLIVTDISKSENFEIEDKFFSNPLKDLIIDSDNYRLFVGDNQGQVFIYLIQNNKLELQIILKTQLFIDEKKKFLLSVASEGNVIIYELGKPGKESSIKDPISQLQLNENTKSIYYDINQRKLYANYKSNMVIYDSITGHPLFSLKTHQNELSKIQYLDKQDIMITSSKDKEIKFWGFSEESVNNIYRTKNNYILVQNKDKDISTFDQQTNYNDDNQYNTNDDNDDLNSWTRDNQEQSVQKKDSQEPIQKDIQNAADDDDLHGWNM